MPDYRRELSFGGFITPGNADPLRAVELARLSEQLGLDLVTFQDHPYRPGFTDTWTLISYVAARTDRISTRSLILEPTRITPRSSYGWTTASLHDGRCGTFANHKEEQ
jgi:alkanesulfonate monooxygenase SsuD/methylene tetrahydromethanopterin reductase-like flavin-dependent oxidoreductase (luciferase family)